VDAFLMSLEPLEYDKTLDGISLLQKFGRTLPPPDSKKLTKGLFELRVRTAVQIRLLYGFWNGNAVIVHGFIKKSGKILPRDIELAHKRLVALA
jgi:phage-related protein